MVKIRNYHPEAFRNFSELLISPSFTFPLTLFDFLTT